MHHDSEDRSSNPSANRPFEAVLNARLSRRSVIKKGGAVGAAAFVASPMMGGGMSCAPQVNLGFDPVDTSTADAIVVPDGYVAQPILPWGDPIDGVGPAFKKDASNTGAEQLLQIGQGHDGIRFHPLGPARNSSTRGLMAFNHEYTLGQLTFPDGTDNWDAEKTFKEQNGHGVSIVQIAQDRNGNWNVEPSKQARRITPNTPAVFSGPAAGHRLLKTENDPTGLFPTGTLNNCGNGYTPWGTYITCEENFNGYFWEETGGAAAAITAEQAAINERYGVGGQGFGYQWATTEDRWRADLQPQENNTFGWIVEIDPYNPDSLPVKRTALGRFKHEGFAFAEGSNGEAVAYMGDDQRFDYVYKFVSAEPWLDMLSAGKSPLDEGTLYVAKYFDDGFGTWLPLVYGEGPLTADNGFNDQGDVLIKARLAADLLGATPMDRPEWTTFDPQTKEAYCTFTNNTRRTDDQVDAANPRAENRFGHILKWKEFGGPQGVDFRWEVFLLAGDAASGATVDTEDAFGSPDGLWLDPFGVLWIQTDGSQPDGSNNQMLAADPVTGELKRFLVGPVDCEITGATMTPDGKTLFINVQHPGDSGSAANPTATSTWPDGDVDGRPRPATVAISRKDGGRVGT